MNEGRTIWWWMAGAVVVAAAIGAWWWHSRMPPPAAEVAAPTRPAPEVAMDETKNGHPIEMAPAALATTGDVAPLPPLAESDSALGAAIGGLVGDKALSDFFHVTGIATRFVATIDNLPRGKVATKLLPLRGPGGAFIVDGAGDERVIGAANAARYAPYLRLAEAVDPSSAAAVYVRFYPLLQQAYRELGYPQGHFNDRLVAVIDHLLATPDVAGPIRLAQPRVLYEFADPALESRSAGQKLLLRMGAENAARAKGRLREFRREITAASPPR
jgi:hypothetical protein